MRGGYPLNSVGSDRVPAVGSMDVQRSLDGVANRPGFSRQPVASQSSHGGGCCRSWCQYVPPYGWIKCYSVSPAQRVQQDGQADESRRLKAELHPVSEVRDIPKKRGRSVLCQAIRVKYVFIKAHEMEYRVRRMCSVMRVRTCSTISRYSTT